MRLWALEDLSTWQRLIKDGTLYITKECVNEYYGWQEEKYLFPYRWIREEMKKRIVPPPVKDIYPIYTIFEWEGKPKVDLRIASWWSQAGKKMVRIEMDCDEHNVLLVNYDLWMYVRNHWYIPESEIDRMRFERKFPNHPWTISEALDHPDQLYQKEVIESWQHIFDLEYQDIDDSFSTNERWIIGWIWEIKLEWLKSYKYYTGRSS